MAPAATTTVKAIKRDIPFAWEGTDKRGNRVKGKSLAPDEAALRAELRRQGIAPSRIRKQSAALASGGKVKPEDIAVFSRQLATMLAAGIPMVQAFEIVGNGNDKPAMQKLILDIKARRRGRHLAARGARPSIRCISTICSSTSWRPASRPVRSSRCSTRSPPTRKRPRR